MNTHSRTQHQKSSTVPKTMELALFLTYRLLYIRKFYVFKMIHTDKLSINYYCFTSNWDKLMKSFST